MKLRVIMLDTSRTYIAIEFENEYIPYGRRLVSIELTDEQCRELQPKKTGYINGHDRFEEIGQVWLEGDSE